MNDGYIKLTRHVEWEGDVLNITDRIKEISQRFDDETSDFVCNRFKCDLSDLREYLRDREAWNKKQTEIGTQWIPVTQGVPKAVEPDANGVIAFSKIVLTRLLYDDGFVWYTVTRYRPDMGMWLSVLPGEGCRVTHWMPINEPGESNDAE